MGLSISHSSCRQNYDRDDDSYLIDIPSMEKEVDEAACLNITELIMHGLVVLSIPKRDDY